MNATKKMDAIGMKALQSRIQELRPTIALETLYRWRQALNQGGGIRDANKHLLIQATKGTEHEIGWPDFIPST